jgi:hypothetical protein
MRWPSRRRPAARVEVLTRPGCHLCEEMVALVRQVAGPAVPVHLVDLDAPGTDPQLRRRCSTLVPVLLVDGVEVAHWQVTPDDVRRALRGGGRGRRFGARGARNIQ